MTETQQQVSIADGRAENRLAFWLAIQFVSYALFIVPKIAVGPEQNATVEILTGLGFVGSVVCIIPGLIAVSRLHKKLYAEGFFVTGGDFAAVMWVWALQIVFWAPIGAVLLMRARKQATGQTVFARAARRLGVDVPADFPARKAKRIALVVVALVVAATLYLNNMVYEMRRPPTDPEVIQRVVTVASDCPKISPRSAVRVPEILTPTFPEILAH
jgi:nitric oxide reductase large subunit